MPEKQQDSLYDNETFEQVAQGVQRQLDEYFELYRSCLQSKQLFSPRNFRIQRLGFHSNEEFATKLIDAGYIKRVLSPDNTTYYFSASCSLTDDELLDHVIERDRQRYDNAAESRRRTYAKKYAR